MATTNTASMSDLKAQVTKTVGAEQSAIALINGLSAQLKAALAAVSAGDQGAALAAVISTMDTSATTLAQAVAANPLPATP